MKFHRSVSPDRIYWIRAAENGPPKGPYTLENLRELAEFGHVTRGTEIRRQPEETFFPLERDGDLVTQVFPERRQLKFGSQYQSPGLEDQHRPVSIQEMLGCDLDEPPGAESADKPSGNRPDTEGSLRLRLDTSVRYETISDKDTDADVLNPRQTLQALAKARALRLSQDSAASWKIDRSVWLSRFSLAARLTGLAVFGTLGVRIWLATNWAGGDPVGVVIDFLSGVVLILAGLILMLPELLRLATAPFDAALSLLIFGNQRSPQKPDLSEVERWQERGDLEKALSVCRRQLGHSPEFMPLHLKAVRLCLRLGWDKEAQRHYRRALKKITCGQDRNLFVGMLRQDGYAAPGPNRAGDSH